MLANDAESRVTPKSDIGSAHPFPHEIDGPETPPIPPPPDEPIPEPTSPPDPKPGEPIPRIPPDGALCDPRNLQPGPLDP
jgi:hypothetical protein